MFAFVTLTLALLSYRCSRMTLVIERQGMKKESENRKDDRRSRAASLIFLKEDDKKKLQKASFFSCLLNLHTAKSQCSVEGKVKGVTK